MGDSDQTRNRDPDLSRVQRDTLTAVLSLVIPRSEDGRLPDAAEYDVWEHICASASDLADIIRDQLDQLERHAQARLGKPLASLKRPDAQAMVDEIRAVEPEFMSDLARQTMGCYYHQDRVLEAIGIDARPPFPKGYEVKSGDLSLLDPVRRRGKVYRDA